jgi:hypothetical protein
MRRKTIDGDEDATRAQVCMAKAEHCGACVVAGVVISLDMFLKEWHLKVKPRWN